jgi:hypothetical protein
MADFQIIIQNSGVSEHNSRALYDAAVALGIEWHGVGVVPFTHEMTGHEGIDFSQPTFWYGSTRLLEIAKARYDGPGVFFNGNFDVFPSEGYPRPVRRDMLNPVPKVCTLKNFMESTVIQPDLKHCVEAGNLIFIRPNSSLKLFAGTVLTQKTWDEKIADIHNAAAEYPDELLGYSEYIDIWAEWRFFIVDGEVVTGSLYKASGRLEMRPASADMLLIAQAAAQQWLPLETCVMDLALTKQGLKVVEFNSVNSAGLYESDPVAFLRAIREAVLNASNVRTA